MAPIELKASDAYARSEAAGIAIVGLACRFPGAPDAATFWSNLCAGVESLRSFTDAELEDRTDAAVRAQRNFIRARSVLEDVDAFDAGFFGMHAREAELTDPQHRVFLECCWETLEDAGYDPATYPGRIGIFAGCSINTYFLRNVLRDRSAVEQFTNDYQVGSYPALIGAGYDFLATRVSYKLDLRGPAMTLQSACSTGLMAVTQACQALLFKQADVMLAGAVSITFPQRRGYVYQDGGIAAADGHCRTFDARSSGTVFGAGAGVVALKRLEDARAAGDHVYAVIRGFGANNDGSRKVGYTAPSIDGQADAIERAHAMAGIKPRSIAYVECHGTATPLGDPIEFAALRKAFSADTAGGAFCALGSVKTNVGHLDVAAGMSGLIKTALAIRHGKIPPTLHFTAPNPRIDFASSPFFVQTELTDWPADAVLRRAGVSAFGLGGTNVHLVLEGADARPAAHAAREPQLFVLSARSTAALGHARERLSAHLAAKPDEPADIAFTLQRGRRNFRQRFALVASDVTEALAKLKDGAPGAFTGEAGREEPPIAFMFPGQGAQYVGMGRGLYARFPAFRDAVDRCARSVEPMLGRDLRELLCPEAEAPSADHSLRSTALAQPALFTVEYALAQLWLSWGIRPAALIGHSIGEIVAACLAGVFTLDDGLRLAVERGRLMQALQPGAMLAVRLPEADLRSMLGPGASIAAVNGPRQSVAAGTFEAIAALERQLAGLGSVYRRLETSHAFHSSMMDAVIEPLGATVRGFERATLAIPCISGVSGGWLTDEEARTPEYWGRHAREPVQFGRGLTTLVESGPTVLIEVGPGSALSTFAQQIVGRGAACSIVHSLPGAGGERGDVETILAGLGRMWVAGAQPDWQGLYAAPRRRVSLPTYPFERTRYWIEEPAPPAAVPQLLEVAEKYMLEQTTNQHAERADTVSASAGKSAAQRRIVALLEELSGEDLSAADSRSSFLELGFDSLFLGRFVKALQGSVGVEVTFRQLLGELPSIEALAEHIASALPPPPHADDTPIVAAATSQASPAVVSSALDAVLREQLQTMQQLMREQLQTLQTIGLANVSVPPLPAQPAPSANGVASEPGERPSRFAPYAPSTRTGASDMTPVQRAHIDALVARTNARTPRSKARAQAARRTLADPRAAAGFRAEWKEMVYPITCARAKGSKLWDIDGNEYIDLVNGFGQTAFGHSPDFVVQAVAEQLERGFPIGPQTELAGDVAALFCELTGNERATFCNTGSEAVMAAMRLARTVTGRNRVVVFDGDYHGQFDEVLVKRARSSGRSLPVAPGIPPDSVANMTVLTYGAPESLTWIREHVAELAAVVVEPVQSRHPELQPAEFLRELETITRESGAALVFDEVVTGFRLHPGGMQAVFGIRADLATYGKVVGGGMPIGILAGKARFMDALDGGYWAYGDESIPEVAPTFFAGTFVRHPLAMAAVRAVLQHVKEAGPQLQVRLNGRGAQLVRRLNAELERCGVTTRIESCGSMFYLSLAGEDRLAGLVFYHLRLRGIYMQEGFPCFLTTAHSDADIERIIAAFSESLAELQAAGIMLPSAAAGTRPAPALAPVEVPLTEGQIEIWLAAQLGDEASCAFNESVTLRLAGTLDEAAFRLTWDRIVARHDALRAVFAPTGEHMRVAAGDRLAYSSLDFGAEPDSDADAALADLVASEAATPFDLISGPPVRGTLIRLGPAAHAFVLTAHHIVCDGWSMNVMLREFAALYEAHRVGRSAELPEPLAFSSYARAQAGRDPAERARIEAFWLRGFSADPVRPLEIPTDRPRPAQKSFRGATRHAHIDAARYRAIKRAGAREGCTLFVTLLAAFGSLIGRLADQTDVVIGVPAAGQALLDDQILVGHCVDFLPIRCRWNAHTRFADYLATLKRTVLDAYEHQTCTLGTIVRKLAPAREAGRVPLAEIQFNLERLADRLELPQLSVDVVPNAKASVNFDLFLNLIESDDGLRLDCDYNSDLFDAATIDRWLRYYQTLLASIADDMTAAVGRVHYLPAAERRTLLDAMNDTSRDYPRDLPVHALFEHCAAAHPDAVAAVCGAQALTYAELERRANQLAHHLLERTQPHGLVGLVLDRSIDMLIAMLATLKAGCAYLPLDPKHPAARLRYILGAANAAALIVDASAEPALIADFAAPIIRLDREGTAIAAARATAPNAAVSAEQLAYSIYTSGSTGLPKGVEVTHRSVVNLLCAMADTPGLSPADAFLAVTTISFDIAALELLLPLTVGARVVIADAPETADAHALLARIEASGITAMQATPAMWRMLLDAGFRSRPGCKMLCGGEALPRALADRLLAGGGELWNMYGPTETTIWSSCKRILADGSPVTIGNPIANTQFYVLDPADQPVPFGKSGQLHIGGDGVARGYVDRPELTSQRFVPNPFHRGRMYRTGDCVRFLASGEIEVLGRLDDQVKLRGFRIELGEVEANIGKLGGIAAAAVRLHEDASGHQRLVGYYVERAGALHSATTLRVALADTLPEYMIPTAWVRLPALPLTPNGKLDRLMLPPPEVAKVLDAEFCAPRTPTEIALAKIWAETLKLDRVSADDDLFALGADSIHLFAITARANRQGLRLVAKQLMRHRTIAELAKQLDLAEPALAADPHSTARLTATPLHAPQTSQATSA